MIKQNNSKQVNDAVLDVKSRSEKGIKLAQKPVISTKAENTSKKRKHGENSPRKTESVETPGFKAMKCRCRRSFYQPIDRGKYRNKEEGRGGGIHEILMPSTNIFELNCFLCFLINRFKTIFQNHEHKN